LGVERARREMTALYIAQRKISEIMRIKKVVKGCEEEWL